MMKKKVLLVDDVRLFLKLEETFFRRAGCEIITAESGRQALDLAHAHLPDLILLDYIMPDIMGDEVCRKLKSDERTRDIPIVMVSTSSDPTDVEKCFSAGATEYVTKPINAQTLLAKAANILNIPQRVHFRIPVTFRVAGEVSGRSFSGFSRNLSRGGLLLECENPITVDDKVSLDLPLLAGGAIINFPGMVVRVDKDMSAGTYLAGICFSELNNHQQAVLDNFIRGGEPRA